MKCALDNFLRLGIVVILLQACNPEGKNSTVSIQESKEESAESKRKGTSVIKSLDEQEPLNKESPERTFIAKNFLGTTWVLKGQGCRQTLVGDYAGQYFLTYMSFILPDQYVLSHVYSQDANCTPTPDRPIFAEEVIFQLAPSSDPQAWKWNIQSHFAPLVYSTLWLREKKFYMADPLDTAVNGLSEEQRLNKIDTALWFEPIGSTAPPAANPTAAQFIEQQLLGRVFRYKGVNASCRSDTNRIFYDTSVAFIAPDKAAITWVHYRDAACTEKTNSAATQYFNVRLSASGRDGIWNLDWGPDQGEFDFTVLKLEGKKFYLGGRTDAFPGTTAETRHRDVSITGWYEDIRPVAN